MKTDQYDQDVTSATECLQRGEVIAYPTEAVYGLGCDPWNQTAVETLCAIKQRDLAKGMIIAAADWSQVAPLIKPLPKDIEQHVKNSWPGHTTWLLPANDHIPEWVRGDHASIAIRVSNHPIVHALCQHFGKPIISTSANVSTETPCLSADEITKQLNDDRIAYIIDAPLGNESKPSTIIDALTGKTLR